MSPGRASRGAEREITVGEMLRIHAPGDVRFDRYDEPALGATEVRIATLYSGISAGTELTHYRGTNPYRGKTWDGGSGESIRGW